MTIRGSVLSVNLGRAMDFEHASAGRTGIDKRPVDHPVQVNAPGRKHVGGSGLVGDDIYDLRHHGGNDQAVYAYAREDLDRWAAELGRLLSSGSFGENLTTIGIDLGTTVVGEHWAIGETLLLEVSDPGSPAGHLPGSWANGAGSSDSPSAPSPEPTCGCSIPGRYPPATRSGSCGGLNHGVTVATVFRAFTTEPHLLPNSARWRGDTFG